MNGNVYGGGYNGTVTGNTVNISGGILNGSADGGYTKSGNATKNTVNITGGEINGTIRTGESASGAANENILNIAYQYREDQHR